MAQRRMFSLKVIDTDEFLDMPQSSQYLYFNLSMRADDDGFVSNPKKIMKMVNCNNDDFKVLTAKSFIIPFQNGVCVIRHWRIHNLIRADRYNETEYLDQKSLLKDNNGKYELQDVIPNGNQMAPQVRLGKVRIGKDRICKEKITHLEFIELTTDEFDKLNNKIGKYGTSEYIDRLNSYIGSKNKKYVSHYHTILSWWQRDGKPVSQKDVDARQSAELNEKYPIEINTDLQQQVTDLIKNIKI